MAWITWKVLAFAALTKGLLTLVKRHFLVRVKLDNAGNVTENRHQRPNWAEREALPILPANTAVPELNSASVTDRFDPSTLGPAPHLSPLEVAAKSCPAPL